MCLRNNSSATVLSSKVFHSSSVRLANAVSVGANKVTGPRDPFLSSSYNDVFCTQK